MHQKALSRSRAFLPVAIPPTLRAALVVAAALACLVPAGCTTGPHPPQAETRPPRKDPKDAKDRSVGTSGPHPTRGKTTGPHPGTGY